MTFVEFVRDLPPQMGPEQVRLRMRQALASCPWQLWLALRALRLQCCGPSAAAFGLRQHCCMFQQSYLLSTCCLLPCRPRASTGATWLTGGAMQSRRNLRSASTRLGALFLLLYQG